MIKLGIVDISNYAQWFGSTLIMIFCLIRFRQRPAYIRVLGIYAAVSFLFALLQIISRLNSYFIHPNTSANIYVLFEALLFSLLYYVVPTHSSFRKVVIVAGVIYVLFYLGAFTFFPTYSFSAIRTARDLLMILFALGYFTYLLRELPEDDLLRFPMFWINAAVIFFFSGTFILSYFRDYIVLVLQDDLRGFWSFRNFFRFAFCLVLSYSAYSQLRSVQFKQKSG